MKVKFETQETIKNIFEYAIGRGEESYKQSKQQNAPIFLRHRTNNEQTFLNTLHF